MYIRMESQKRGRFVAYEYGEDLFGDIYLDKIKGKERGKLEASWVLPDLGSLVRLLDFEIYKREQESYSSVAI